MSTNRVEGAVRKGTGAVKQGAGRALGDERMEAEGAAEKTGGKVQNAVGRAQDKIGNAIKH